MLSNSPTFVIEMFLYALLGGVLPALFWLWFWLQEEHPDHEPHGTIALTFLFGMLAVFIVYPFQKWTDSFPFLQAGSLALFLTWAFFEEIMKFLAAYLIALRTEIFDEPIDAFVYLMTAAVGFAAMENTLFLLAPLLNGVGIDALSGIITGNLRFLGTSLIHVLASGTLSLFIAAAFYKSKVKKILYTGIGLITAVLLHAIFNFFIIQTEKQSIFIVFSFVWFTIILLIIILERIKAIKKSKTQI